MAESKVCSEPVLIILVHVILFDNYCAAFWPLFFVVAERVTEISVVFS